MLRAFHNPLPRRRFHRCRRKRFSATVARCRQRSLARTPSIFPGRIMQVHRRDRRDRKEKTDFLPFVPPCLRPFPLHFPLHPSLFSSPPPAAAEHAALRVAANRGAMPINYPLNPDSAGTPQSRQRRAGRLVAGPARAEAKRIGHKKTQKPQKRWARRCRNWWRAAAALRRASPHYHHATAAAASADRPENGISPISLRRASTRKALPGIMASRWGGGGNRLESPNRPRRVIRSKRRNGNGY
jgi:hypothetical protein